MDGSGDFPPGHPALGSAASEPEALSDQCAAALLAAALLRTIRPSTATPVLALIRNGLTSIEAMRVPASAIRLERPTMAFTADASCKAGFPRYPLRFTPALARLINPFASASSSARPA